jgi:hypothetical protein
MHNAEFAVGHDVVVIVPVIPIYVPPAGTIEEIVAGDKIHKGFRHLG